MWKVGALTGCALMMLGLSAGARAAAAHVNFVDPEHFTDHIRYGDQNEVVAKHAEIARHIEQLAARKLPADQTLDVEVLDIRLVGSDEGWPDALTSPPLRAPVRGSFGTSFRQTSTATWPSITLRYQLKQGEQVLAKGEESISDKAYLDRLNAYSNDDPLRFEKQLLDTWLQRRLVRHEAAR